MVFRFILRYLANNEQLVQKLSESYFMRSAARFVVSLFNRGKLAVEEKGLNEKLSTEELKKVAQQFANNFKEELRRAREQYERKNK